MDPNNPDELEMLRGQRSLDLDERKSEPAQSVGRLDEQPDVEAERLATLARRPGIEIDGELDDYDLFDEVDLDALAEEGEGPDA